MWRWPTFELTEEQAPFLDNSALEPAGPSWTQVYSHRRERVTPYWVELTWQPRPGPGQVWVPRSQIQALPLGRRDDEMRTLISGPRGHKQRLPKSISETLLDRLIY